MSQTLLLYSSRPEDQVFAREAALVADLSCVVAGDLDTVIKHILETDVGACLIDASYDENFYQFETAVKEQIGLFSDKTNTNRLHFICSDDLEHMKHLSQSPLFGSFVLRKYKDEASAQAAGTRYGYVLKASLQDRAFGLGSFFGDKSQVQKIQLQKASQKQQVVEAIRAYLVKAKYPSRMANVIANAVDELVMNAIFTAPVDEMGKRTFESTPRDSEISLEGRHGVDVTIIFDGKQVGISATDQFGAIDKDKLITHLATVYNDAQYKVKTSVAGAGIGLASTFRSGGSLIFICDKNARTEVAVIFERLENYREFKDQFRFLSTQFYY